MGERFLKRTLLVIAGLLLFGTCVAMGGKVPQDLSVRSLEITGTIALVNQGYIIRGSSPAELFTILNPDADALEKYIRLEKTVTITAKIVSGDNIEIQSIDGQEYPKRP